MHKLTKIVTKFLQKEIKLFTEKINCNSMMHSSMCPFAKVKIKCIYDNYHCSRLNKETGRRDF